jgi:hypothetical protein
MGPYARLRKAREAPAHMLQITTRPLLAHPTSCGQRIPLWALQATTIASAHT